MKVLKKATNLNLTFTTTCGMTFAGKTVGGCGAELEIERTDCTLVEDQRDGNYWTCNCPECGKDINFALPVVPSWT